MLWLVNQRYELKANHNELTDWVGQKKVVVSKSKIRIESKSQRFEGSVTHLESCG